MVPLLWMLPNTMWSGWPLSPPWWNDTAGHGQSIVCALCPISNLRAQNYLRFHEMGLSHFRFLRDFILCRVDMYRYLKYELFKNMKISRDSVFCHSLSSCITDSWFSNNIDMYWVYWDWIFMRCMCPKRAIFDQESISIRTWLNFWYSCPGL